jgi:hypothetical protein
VKEEEEKGEEKKGEEEEREEEGMRELQRPAIVPNEKPQPKCLEEIIDLQPPPI